MDNIKNTELWKLFLQKVKSENLDIEFISAVENVCKFGVEISKYIVLFFPNFTLHDIAHITNVCNWMIMLLGDRKNELSARETAMLLMSACCHDVGMSVSKEQEKKVEEKAGSSEKKQREYVRIHHHERVKEHLTHKKWAELDSSNIFQKYGIRLADLLSLCESHGKNLDDIEAPRNSRYDFRLCSVLLRLADILDFDSTRASKHLFEHLGLDSPEDLEMEFSKVEWIKNRSGNFSIDDNRIIFDVTYDDPNIEHKVNDYLKWVKDELNGCTEYISKYVGNWSNFKLPYKIEQTVERVGYKGGDFQITMNQEHIIELLTGENLYSDPCVFVRELLQNSIDAILWRDKNDPYFDAEKDGKITITTWYDESGQGWFRIEDNGTGMDENIIMNYFLKAGNSYYNSDDFDKERNLYSRNKTYKPISRFGIGILSCFMSDKKNKLEVSTKRYSHNPAVENSGVRLSVTSLNGYFTLANENEQDFAEWQKMPVRSREEEMCFKNEPGTTICVGMNLFSLGEYRNIKEVVDKYVQFPEVQVEYYGPERDKKYYTKAEFTNAVNALKEEHGDTNPIVCTHSIPEDEFEWLKKQLPELEFESSPELVFTYYPLDNFTSGNNLCGMYVDVLVKTNYKQWIFEFNNVSYKLGLRSKIYFSQKGVTIHYSAGFPNELQEKIEKLKTPYSEDNKKAIDAYDCLNFGFNRVIAFDTVCGLLSESERILFRMFVENQHQDIVKIAYNGVLADSLNISKIQFDSTQNKKMVVLLSGNYAPEVNMERNKITNLPIECAFELESIEKTIKRKGRRYIYSFFGMCYSYEYLYLTEKELCKLIEKHSEWEQNVFLRTINLNRRPGDILEYKTIPKIDEAFKKGEIFRVFFLKKSLYDNVALAFLKKRYTLCVYDKYLQLADKKDSSMNTDDFPVHLFAEFPENPKIFVGISNSYNNIYSPEHRFSKWLIENREKLQKELPELYHKILEIMLMSNRKDEIIEGLNARLNQLKNYKSNMFNITDELLLTKSDFY